MVTELSYSTARVGPGSTLTSDNIFHPDRDSGILQQSRTKELQLKACFQGWQDGQRVDSCCLTWKPEFYAKLTQWRRELTATSCLLISTQVEMETRGSMDASAALLGPQFNRWLTVSYQTAQAETFRQEIQ